MKKTFHHIFLMRWFSHAFNVLAFVVPLYLVAQFGFEAIGAGHAADPSLWGLIILLALLSGVCLVLTANYYSEIDTSEDGLYVSFLWRKLHVSWEDVVEIKPTGLGFLGPHKTWIVLTGALTPFHRMYGILYGFSLSPGFIIAPGMSDSDELVHLIEGHVTQNHIDSSG